MSPTEPRVEEAQTPSLIDQTLSMVEQSMHQLVAKQEGVPAPPVQEQRTASLIGQTLAMVAISESTVSDAPPSLQPPVANRPSKDIVLPKPQVQGEQELSMVKGVAASEPESTKLASPSSFRDTAQAGEAIPPSSQASLAKTLTPEERLDIERANMRKRVETFKANQERFRRQREEYYEATLAKIRASVRSP
jgi:hypothetical protein